MYKMRNIKIQRKRIECQYILILLIITFSIFGLAENSEAANIYVDQSLSADCIIGNYSTSSRNCSGNDGNGYRSFQTALNNLHVGDNLYLREGTYNGCFDVPILKGNPNLWTTVASYPGEWAIIRGDGTKEYALGRSIYDKSNDNGYHSYWKFENLEITGDESLGLFVSGGPFIVRGCYIHDNIKPLIYDEPVFTGTGVNDLNIVGGYWKEYENKIIIEIDGKNPDTFRWNFEPFGDGWQEHNLITGQTFTLGWRGLNISFDSTSGHNIGDRWEFDVNSGCGNNPAGITGMVWHDSIIEYNHFDNNGCSTPNDPHTAHIQIHSDYGVYCSEYGVCDTGSCWDWTTGQCHAGYGTRNNTIRYNLFSDSGDMTANAIHHKAAQYFIPYTNPDSTDWSKKDYGDKIHHNIFTSGFSSAIQAQQDFVQIFNNIVQNSNIQLGDWGRGVHARHSIYNNQISGGRIELSYYLHGPSGAVYADNPFGEDIILRGSILNNILDGYPETYISAPIKLGSPDMEIGAFDSGVVDYDDLLIKNNYIYSSSESADIYNMGAAKSGTCFDEVSFADFESCYSTASNNARKASSEESDSLYQGTFGANKYKTRGEHLISSTRTVANGGVGGGHPYLNGVQIPSYVGATNPNDNDWVQGVLNLATISSLQNVSNGDPDWIEGNPETGDETSPGIPNGLSVS